jgi:oligopeptidase B
MTGGGPVLLHMHMGAGHSGASGRFEALADTALEFAFAIACAARATKASSCVMSDGIERNRSNREDA